jgi:mxaJ protein
MCSSWAPDRLTRFLCAAWAAVLLGCASADAHSRDSVLRVCADPNNLPFSDQRERGFENRIARLIANRLGMQVEYTWRPQRRGFIRNTLNAKTCDLIAGLPTASELAWTTAPYYRSTYVFVTRKASRLRLTGLDDPRLRTLRIGVHVIGDDYANTPPAHALARRGIIRNVSGYTIYGDYSTPNPPARLVDAVANGEIDVAIAWGPLAGYFGARGASPLELAPVTPQVDLPFNQFVYDIGMAVRRGDTTLHHAVEQVLYERRSDIEGILASYGVPLVPKPGASSR